MTEPRTDEEIEQLIGMESGPRKFTARSARWLSAIASIAAVLCGILICADDYGKGIGAGSAGFAGAAVFWGLAYGVLRSSRICAVVLFVYYIGFLWLPPAGTVPRVFSEVPIGFAVFFLLGIFGTFYPRSKEKKPN